MGLDPVWNHVVDIVDYVNGKPLEFRVFDEDIGRTDDFIGGAMLPSDVFLPNGSGIVELPLSTGRLKVRVSPPSALKAEALVVEGYSGDHPGVNGTYIKAPYPHNDRPVWTNLKTTYEVRWLFYSNLRAK